MVRRRYNCYRVIEYVDLMDLSNCVCVCSGHPLGIGELQADEVEHFGTYRLVIILHKLPQLHLAVRLPGHVDHVDHFIPTCVQEGSTSAVFTKPLNRAAFHFSRKRYYVWYYVVLEGKKKRTQPWTPPRLSCIYSMTLRN